MLRVLAALAAGASITLSLPAHDIWPAAIVGVALLALATRGAGFRFGLVLGLLAGLTYFVPSLSWSGIYVGAVPWLALAVLQALYVAALGGLVGWAQRAGRVRPLLVATAWVAQEAARDRTPYGGFPWIRLATSQSDSPLGRLAVLGGEPLVTCAVALLGGLLAAFAWALWHRRGRWLLRSGLGLALSAGLFAASAVAPVADAAGGPSARIMAVQGNVPQAGLDFNAQRRAVLDNHVRATLAAAAQISAGSRPKPDLVVWPENSSDIDPQANPDAQAEIVGAVAAVGAPIVVGTLSTKPWPNLYNVSFLYQPGAGITSTYIKQHPVPFAEYIPSQDFYRRLSSAADLITHPFVAGAGPVLFTVPSTSGTPIVAGPSICFEVAYDDLVRRNVELGANLLLVQTNNATFGYSDESAQQLAISKLRAIETGRSVVHVSTVGISALITPDGTEHQATSLFSQAVIEGELPLRTEQTVAVRVGAWPEWVGCAVFGLLLLFGAGRRGEGPTDPASRPGTRPLEPTMEPTHPEPALPEGTR